MAIRRYMFLTILIGLVVFLSGCTGARFSGYNDMIYANMGNKTIKVLVMPYYDAYHKTICQWDHFSGLISSILNDLSFNKGYRTINAGYIPASYSPAEPSLLHSIFEVFKFRSKIEGGGKDFYESSIIDFVKKEAKLSPGELALCLYAYPIFPSKPQEQAGYYYREPYGESFYDSDKEMGVSYLTVGYVLYDYDLNKVIKRRAVYMKRAITISKKIANQNRYTWSFQETQESFLNRVTMYLLADFMPLPAAARSVLLGHTNQDSASLAKASVSCWDWINETFASRCGKNKDECFFNIMFDGDSWRAEIKLSDIPDISNNFCHKDKGVLICESAGDVCDLLDKLHKALK